MEETPLFEIKMLELYSHLVPVESTDLELSFGILDNILGGFWAKQLPIKVLVVLYIFALIA